MVWYDIIISRLWAESTPTVTGMDPTLSAHVPLAHFLINHIIVSPLPTPSPSYLRLRIEAVDQNTVRAARYRFVAILRIWPSRHADPAPQHPDHHLPNFRLIFDEAFN